MKSLGHVAYDAYCANSGGKSLVSGAPLPDWSAVPDSIKSAWEAAAAAVASLFTNNA